MTPLHHSVRTSLRHLTTILSLVGVATALGLSCGGSRDPVLEKTTGSSGKRNTSGGATSVESGGASTAGASSTSGGANNGGANNNAGTTGSVVNAYAGAAGALIEIKPAWDWNGVIGTGQSLAVGNSPVVTKTPLYNNLMLSRDSITVPPFDAALADLKMVPLIERLNKTGYPAPYPKNLWGETPHSAMANQLTAMVKYNSGIDFITVHSIVGESGQGMVALQKVPTRTVDTTGRITAGVAYEASIFEVTAIARLAAAAGKTYGVGAIVMTHGETDSGSGTYKDELVKLLADYNADISAITGQTIKIPMFISQQFAFPNAAGQKPLANQTQWQLGVEHPGEFVCTGPKYQYPGHGDGTHLATAGYMQLGEKTGQIYYERLVLGHDWQPLQPLSATRAGSVITVKFHVPVPPLAWDENLPAATTSWPNGRGFELRGGGAIVPIESVAIVDDTVQITCATDISTAKNLVLGYAMTAGASVMPVASKAWRWGQLRDSDPFVGSSTNVPQPNYCVAFEIPVP